MNRESGSGNADRNQELDTTRMRELLNGDSTALEYLYDRYSTPAFSVIIRIVRDRQVAEELLQELFLRIWQKATVFDPERGQVQPWILGIAHNLGLNELRSRRRRPQSVPAPAQPASVHPLDTTEDPGADPHQIAWEHERTQTLVRALSLLPPVQQSVIELYARGYSQSEIADRLNQPLGTVKTRMRRGLHQLRDIVHHLGLEGDPE
ncbi:MAG: sigma-70 family RNA polymerase sigma factor [Thermomicrobiales bacterium]